MTPVFGYIRQSKTRDGSESIPIQKEAIERAAPLLNATIVGWFIEPPSTSGYKNRGRKRPEFPKMLAAIRQGEARGIVVYKSERLSRGGGPGWAPVFDALESAGIDTDHAIATPSGWMSEFEISIRAAMDREESKKLADRMADVRAREARNGAPRGGGRRPFGYETDLRTVRPDEAELIREAADRVLQGESAWAIARTWNERGVPGPGGGHWGSQTLKRILQSARIAGLRDHRGEVVAPAVWPAILDREVWEKVRVAVEENSTRAGRPGGVAARTHLLTGLLRCGRCGGRMVARTRNGGRKEYTCQSPESSGQAGSCNGCVIKAAPAEQDVFDMVAGTVLDPEALAKILAAAPQKGETRNLGSEVRELEDKKAKLLDLYLDGKVDKAIYEARLTSIEDQLGAVRTDLAARANRPVLSTVPTTEDALAEAWASRGLEWQRLVVEALFERITVRPGRAPSPRDRLAYLPR